MNSKAIRKQLLAAVAMVLVAAVALGSSTYAWFVSNTQVKAQTATVSATTVNTLLISEAGKNAWGTVYTFDTGELDTLAPVSTTAAGNLGGDGKTITFFKDTGWAADAVTGKTSQYNANKFGAATANTDYFVESFDIKASKGGLKLYMDNASAITQTAGKLDQALRIALVVKGDGNEDTDGVYLYQADNTQGTAESATFYNTTLSSLGCDGITKAIKAATTGTAAVAGETDTITAKNVTFASGANTIKNFSDSLATKATDTNSLISTVGNADLLYTFEDAEDIVNITLYIWMEGCDYDCNAAMISELTTAVNQFTAALSFGAAE